MSKAVKRNPSPRNPLKDLNGSSTTLSSELPPRRGCSNFRLFSSSSKSTASSAAKSIPKSASPALRTLPAAKNTPKSSADARSLAPLRKPSKSGLERPKQNRQVKPQKPKSSNSVWEDDSTSRRLFQKSSVQKGEVFELKTVVVDSERNGDLANGSKITPLLQSTPEKEGEKQNSNTPMTTTTPPIHASISPEFACGNPLLPTPTCFAAGHLIAGIPDRRKCRPRGILKVGGGDVRIVDPGSLSSTPPLAKASMHWLSSPSQLTGAGRASGSGTCRGIELSDFDAEASVKWLLSSTPSANGHEASDFSVDHVSGLDTSPSTGCGSWRISPADRDDATVISPEFGCLRDANTPNSETTPLHKVGVWRTPTSDSSISPFSMILQKAEASSCCQVVGLQEVIGGHRYGSALENSPLPEESWSNGNLMSTPFSNTSMEKQSRLPSMCKQEITDDSVPIAESLSPRILVPNNSSNSPDMSFQFGCTATDSKSVDLAEFRKSPRQNSFGMGSLHMGSLSDSTMRISWREGLVSRILEMHELDSCLRLSDAEEDPDIQKEDLLCSEQELECDPNGQPVKHGFGSVELLCNKQVDRSCDEKNSDVGIARCSESISIDAYMMDLSSDSDWTMFFKNDLFKL